MNVATAFCPPASVAVTVVPDVPLGTLNVQLNAPVAPVVREPEVQLLMVTPSKTSDARIFDTEKPVPDIVTVVPTGPEVTESLIAGVVTVNDPDAVCASESLAVTVVPDVPLGTLNVQLSVPVAVAVIDPDVQPLIVTPSNTSDVSFFDAGKPVPDTVTFSPMGP